MAKTNIQQMSEWSNGAQLGLWCDC